MGEIARHDVGGHAVVGHAVVGHVVGGTEEIVPGGRGAVNGDLVREGVSSHVEACAWRILGPLGGVAVQSEGDQTVGGEKKNRGAGSVAGWAEPHDEDEQTETARTSREEGGGGAVMSLVGGTGAQRWEGGSGSGGQGEGRPEERAVRGRAGPHLVGEGCVVEGEGVRGAGEGWRGGWGWGEGPLGLWGAVLEGGWGGRAAGEGRRQLRGWSEAARSPHSHRQHLW